MGGWKRYDSCKHPPEACKSAIEAALPLPKTIREARDEWRYWNERDDELCHALEQWGEEQLDLPAAYRRETVRRLAETELSAVSFTDLLERSRLYQTIENLDADIECTIHRDLEQLVAEMGVGHPSTDGQMNRSHDVAGRGP